jgi:hypothetical protein
LSAEARSAEADSTATEVDPAAFDAVVNETEDELEFVGFGPRTPKVDAGATETDLGSYLDVLPPEAEEDLSAVARSAEEDLSAVARSAEEDATATDVGELSELEAAVADLAAQVEADPLHEVADAADATATDVGNLSTLKKAVEALADEVDTGQPDEEAEDQADEEPEDEPDDITHSQLDIVRGDTRRVDPADETEAD